MKKLIIATYLLTLADIICTTIGVKSGLIYEFNPLLHGAMNENPLLIGAFMLVGTGILFWGIYKVRHKIRWLVYPMTGLLVIKILVVCLHINWISAVFML